MKKWFEIQNKAAEPAAEILIYEQIGKDWFSDDGIGAKDFADALAEIPKDRPLTVGINSPGGNVWDGLAIYHLLKARGDKVTTRIDGIAASIASVIALAGSKVLMPENALMMIHRAWGVLQGNAADMTKMASDLEKHDDVIAGIYSAKNGKSKEANLAAMDSETWFNGTEARAFGLVDATTPQVKMAASFDLSRFKNFGATSGTQIIPATSALASDEVAPSSLSAGIPPEENQPTAAAPGGNPTPTNTMPTQDQTPAAALPATDFAPVIAAINKLGDTFTATANQPGAAPLSGTVTVSENPAVAKFRSMEHGSTKASFIKAHYNLLARELPAAGIYNANTVDSGLANSLLSSAAVDVMRTRIAPLGAFTRQVELSPLSKRQVINVPLISTSGGINTNPANFETGDTTAADVAVTVNQYNRNWYVSHADGNLGIKLAQLAPTNAKVLAEGIMALVTAKMASPISSQVIGTAANFSSSALPAILGAGKNFAKTTLLLDGGHLAYLLPTNNYAFKFGEEGAYGFDGGIYKNNLWTGATTNAAGFVCGPDAIVIATGQPASLPSGEMISQEVIDLGNSITCTVSTWFSRSTRAIWGSYDVMFGCSVGDSTQAKVLLTA